MSTSAFEQGKLAYRANLPMSACEYPQGSDFRTQWMAGWTHCQRTDEARGHAEPASDMMADVARRRMRASNVPRQS
ncbi:hypothetical protein DYI37_03760 [Fulvimarina endophytica]|uniref:Ribosome modulation factor n=1 Tax=Fulvimarina endophytica TaxID=2293836 RepID=A0A371X6X8_9HYPH|nr:Rmf/CrpP family protein [Fulvimarina endophytica]RFC64992.1 hypothetical protein DYI37_03760 [Fulvimarina endophytica]